MTTTIAPAYTIAQELLTPYSIEYQREFLLSKAPPRHPFCGRDIIEIRKPSGIVYPKRKQLRNRCHECRYENAVKYASGESGWYVQKFFTPKKSDWENTREREKYRLIKLGAIYQGFAVQQFDSITVFVVASSPDVVIDLQENGYDYYETRTDKFAAYLKSITVPDYVKGRRSVRPFGNYDNYKMETLVTSDSSGNMLEDAEMVNELERQAIERYEQEKAALVKTEEEADEEKRVLRSAAWVLDRQRTYPAWLMDKAYERFAVPIYIPLEVGRWIVRSFQGYYFDELSEARRTLFLEEWEPYLQIQDKIDEIVNKLPYDAAVWVMGDEALELVELRRKAEEVRKELESKTQTASAIWPAIDV